MEITNVKLPKVYRKKGICAQKLIESTIHRVTGWATVNKCSSLSVNIWDFEPFLSIKTYNFSDKMHSDISSFPPFCSTRNSLYSSYIFRPGNLKYLFHLLNRSCLQLKVWPLRISGFVYDKAQTILTPCLFCETKLLSPDHPKCRTETMKMSSSLYHLLLLLLFSGSFLNFSIFPNFFFFRFK